MQLGKKGIEVKSVGGGSTTQVTTMKTIPQVGHIEVNVVG